MIPYHPLPQCPLQPHPMIHTHPMTIKTKSLNLNAIVQKVNKRNLTLEQIIADKDGFPIDKVLLPEV